MGVQEIGEEDQPATALFAAPSSTAVVVGPVAWIWPPQRRPATPVAASRRLYREDSCRDGAGDQPSSARPPTVAADKTRREGQVMGGTLGWHRLLSPLPMESFSGEDEGEIDMKCADEDVKSGADSPSFTGEKGGAKKALVEGDRGSYEDSFEVPTSLGVREIGIRPVTVEDRFLPSSPSKVMAAADDCCDEGSFFECPMSFCTRENGLLSHLAVEPVNSVVQTEAVGEILVYDDYLAEDVFFFCCEEGSVVESPKAFWLLDDDTSSSTEVEGILMTSTLKDDEIQEVRSNKLEGTLLLREEAELLQPAPHKSHVLNVRLEDKPDCAIYRFPNFGSGYTKPQNRPKSRRPKNHRDKGINMLDRNGKDISPGKLLEQSDFVTGLNLQLITLYKSAILIGKMMTMCDEANNKRDSFSTRLVTNAKRNQDYGLLGLIYQVQKDEKCLSNIISDLKVFRKSILRVGFNLRQAVIDNGGRPVNDPLSKSS
uniref:Uncharacterized protein n=1 Tax=Leersia perrieri TaxID=77586 RepID=A0A0D9XUJ2_9ORYZ